MKKKLFKTLGIIACAVLLIGGSIAGTYAYLTSTATTQNTFTVGNVTITMDETAVDAYGEAIDGAARTTTQAEPYKLIPGRTYIKDPIIHVDADSEACWLFVKIEDGISGIQDTKTIATQLADNGWIALGNGTVGVYYHQDIAQAGANVTVFEYFKVLGTVANNALTACAGQSIVVTAYAIQADGFGTAYDAWTAASGEFNGN